MKWIRIKVWMVFDRLFIAMNILEPKTEKLRKAIVKAEEKQNEAKLNGHEKRKEENKKG